MFDFLRFFISNIWKCKNIYFNFKSRWSVNFHPLDDIDNQSRAVFDERFKLRFWEVSWFHNFINRIRHVARWFWKEGRGKRYWYKTNILYILSSFYWFVLLFCFVKVFLNLGWGMSSMKGCYPRYPLLLYQFSFCFFLLKFIHWFYKSSIPPTNQNKTIKQTSKKEERMLCIIILFCSCNYIKHVYQHPYPALPFKRVWYDW